MEEKIEGTALINDLTTGGVSKKLLKFSVPFIMSYFLQIAYNMIDMVIVGNVVGSVALSGVSVGGDIMMLATSLCMGFASAGQVMVSQNIGSGDRDGVKKTIGTMFTFMTLFSLAITFIGLLSMDWLLAVVNTPKEALSQAKSYSLICYGGMFFIFGYNYVSSALRGMGDSRHPFIFIAVASVTNLLLDLLFVAVLKMEAMGAALATVIGQGVSFITSLVFLYRKREDFCFDFKLKSFKMDRPTLKILVKLGVPMALQHSAVSISKLFVSSYVNAYGVVASAVTGVGHKLTQCAMVVTNAMNAAGTSMIGQNFGAGKMDRIKKTMYVCFAVNIVFCSILAIAVSLFPEQLFAMFNDEPEVLEMCHDYVIVAVLGFIGSAVRSPMLSLFNGLGNGKLSLTVGLLDGVVVRIGIAMLLGITMNMGILGFWLGDSIAGYIPFIIGGIYFWSGMWMKRTPVTVKAAQKN